MATTNLALVTAATVHVVDADVHAGITLPAGAALTAGCAMSISTAGKWQLADANTEATRDQVWFCTHAAAVGEAVTGYKHVVTDGFDVGGLAYDAPIYLSDTAGAWSSGTPTTGTSFIVGRVEPVSVNMPGVAPDKVIRFCTL